MKKSDWITPEAEEVLIGMLVKILKDDIKMIDDAVNKLERKKKLKPYEEEDLKANFMYRNALKTTLKYYAGSNK